ncbi:hypothetical protein ACJ41O_010363 [Fusarium nematophilum]
MAAEEFDPTTEFRKLIHLENCACMMDFTMLFGSESPPESLWHQQLVRGGDAFFFVYNATDRASFEFLHDVHRALFASDGSGKPVWVLATKADRPREDIAVLEHEGEAFSRRIGARFRSVSAREGLGLEEEIAAEIVCEVILSKTRKAEAQSRASGEGITQGNYPFSLQGMRNKVNRLLHRETRK